MAQLQFHDAGRPLFVFVLKSARTVIGRSDACDLALPSESVSRVHCFLEQRGDRWFVVDRSRHGTSVNGQRIESSKEVVDGDDLGIGTYSAHFVTAEDTSRSVTTATSPIAAAIHEEVLEGNEE